MDKFKQSNYDQKKSEKWNGKEHLPFTDIKQTLRNKTKKIDKRKAIDSAELEREIETINDYLQALQMFYGAENTEQLFFALQEKLKFLPPPEQQQATEILENIQKKLSSPPNNQSELKKIYGAINKLYSLHKTLLSEEIKADKSKNTDEPTLSYRSLKSPEQETKGLNDEELDFVLETIKNFSLSEQKNLKDFILNDERERIFDILSDKARQKERSQKTEEVIKKSKSLFWKKGFMAALIPLSTILGIANTAKANTPPNSQVQKPTTTLTEKRNEEKRSEQESEELNDFEKELWGEIYHQNMNFIYPLLLDGKIPPHVLMQKNIWEDLSKQYPKEIVIHKDKKFNKNMFLEDANKYNEGANAIYYLIKYQSLKELEKNVVGKIFNTKMPLSKERMSLLKSGPQYADVWKSSDPNIKSPAESLLDDLRSSADRLAKTNSLFKNPTMVSILEDLRANEEDSFIYHRMSKRLEQEIVNNPEFQNNQVKNAIVFYRSVLDTDDEKIINAAAEAMEQEAKKHALELQKQYEDLIEEAEKILDVLYKKYKGNQYILEKTPEFEETFKNACMGFINANLTPIDINQHLSAAYNQMHISDIRPTQSSSEDEKMVKSLLGLTAPLKIIEQKQWVTRNISFVRETLEKLKGVHIPYDLKTLPTNLKGTDTPQMEETFIIQNQEKGRISLQEPPSPLEEPLNLTDKFGVSLSSRPSGQKISGQIKFDIPSPKAQDIDENDAKD